MEPVLLESGGIRISREYCSPRYCPTRPTAEVTFPQSFTEKFWFYGVGYECVQLLASLQAEFQAKSFALVAACIQRQKQRDK
jgi:hypothetical protein